MACATCNEDNTDVRSVCRVCELNDGDTTIKRVKYCKACGAYICKLHMNDYLARGVAAIKSLLS